ncbi:putative transcription factor C2H2 family [Helianthus annuus]|uniref:Transcription factor C2H2 family n=1 Tax=Helianthus annuus TaxID=4232 RepID=A0A9K3INN7_HELAN|nr:uncharacterized protein LOC110868807 [Helianthus annuus]XP_021973755.1 uncharacterized protein LOC110868807 [Helianthus annuus]KAF5799920.1 putative transcription factor C2H2 family [Helianthus annuus]KAJ0551303.1 putative transcription factor C2H2 family [Helianthus annuus]KAJ0558309.1 putative transcription factor C2H2 family [Helianthus annuus]KAJ0564268.1 putative transcription factor C2H2 family [Helianthus annuus]KAJ0729596.1 putative transcription factor C2H2 family [Helianthus annu
MMSNEEEKRCPLCAEEMDWTDQQLKPCKCGYEVCVWCWHHIMDMAEKGATEGLCPACRTPYDKSRIVGLKSNIQRVAANNSSRKQKQPKAKQRPNEVKKDLSNVRVIQRRMAYIIGLPISLADEDLLQRKDYFGRYGKVTKVSLSRTAGGTVQQFVNDTCSVYITYSKEEEAVRCIQSVHGYVLDGRFLRASFGTAKYCHAWLRNTPCNNVACLYLHSIGAEEDSFGKDEIAAVHTRNRVQEIVGATEYLHKRSGSTLPSPVDEHSNSRSASAQEPVFSRCQEDVAYAAVASGDHLFCSKDKDGAIKLSKHTTSFVDIVGRSYNSGSDKDTSSSVSEGPMLNICSDMSSVCVNRSNHDNAEGSHLVSPKSSTSKLYSEPFREASRLPSVELDDLTLKDTNITKEQSCLNPVGVVKTYSDDAWWHTESSSRNGYGVNNNANSLLSNGYDRIYGGSKSFFSEEIVEHLRRLDDSSLADDDENSAAVENSIISNILSLDFDGCEDSVLPRTVTGLFEGKDGRHGSSWSFQNSDHSRFSFANEDSVENQDRAYKPHYQAPRVQSVIPPGFSKPPPGFSSGVRSEPVVSASSGTYVKNSLPNNHYRMPSIGSLSNSSDDLIDPAIMAVGRGNSSSYDTRSSSFNEETKLWLLMQQQQQSASATHHDHDPRTSFMQQHISPRFPSRDDYYKDLTSRLVDQSYTQQQYSHPKFSNGHITNGYRQLHLDGAQQVNTRNEVGGLQARIHGNGRFGLEKLLPGYGDYKFQMPSSGDVYTRVFGM